MTPDKILDALNDLDGSLIREAKAQTQSARKRPGRRFGVLLAAVIALMAVTITAFASEAVAGWFRQYFTNQSDAPLTSDQIDFIEEYEQIIAETQSNNGWTVELKSAMCDGKTGYVIFGVTAPEGIDLRDIPGRPDESRIIPGNTGMKAEGEELVLASIPLISKEQNYTWSYSYGLEEDGDGRNNTINYMFQLDVERLYNDKDILLDAPFGGEFYFCFDKFVRQYRDTEYEQELLNTKYAGQTDYMMEPEEVERIYQAEVLTEGMWKFTVTFDDTQAEAIELISAPIYTEGLASVEIESDALFKDRKWEIMDIKMTSFKLTTLGATITCDFEEPVVDALFVHDGLYGYEDRFIFVVMKDGTQIALYVNGRSGNLKAKSPIVLSEVDYVLLSDGTKLPMPE